MNAEVLEIFARDLVSTDELFNRTDQLSALKQRLAQVNVTIDNKIYQKLDESLQKGFEKAVEKGFSPTSAAVLTEGLNEIFTYLKGLTIVKITLAFQADDSFLSSLNQEITGTVGRKTVLDVNVDPGIVGGMVVEYNGRYKDYSQVSKLEAYLSQKLAEDLQKAKQK